MVTGPFDLSEFGVDYCICRDVGVLGLSATTSVLWHRQGGRGSVAGPVLGPPEDGWITVERGENRFGRFTLGKAPFGAWSNARRLEFCSSLTFHGAVVFVEQPSSDNLVLQLFAVLQARVLAHRLPVSVDTQHLLRQAVSATACAGGLMALWLVGADAPPLVGVVGATAPVARFRTASREALVAELPASEVGYSIALLC